MGDVFEEDNLEIQILTKEYVKELSKIWKHLFSPDMCKTNLGKLKDHVRSFYKDLVAESIERQHDIEKEIENLKDEAEHLARALKMDFKFNIGEEDVHDGSVPLIYIQTQMDASLGELREILHKRQEEIFNLVEEEDELCNILGEKPKKLSLDPLPSAEEIMEFRHHLRDLEEKKAKRQEEMDAMRKDIKGFMKTLEVKARFEEDTLLNKEKHLDKDTFESLKLMYDRYKSEVEDVHEKIDLIRKKLVELWDRLSVSPSTRKRVEKHTEYNLRTYDVVSGEYQRLEELRRQNIKLFVEQIRAEIRHWWEKTMKSETEQNRFTNINSTCYTDDLLELHEMELEELKIHYESNKRIFDLYNERKVLWERMLALEAKANEPGRYKNRGGQLLKEEKERKTIASKLPKIEKEISDLVHEYEAAERKPFLVYGENILDVMIQDWEKKRQEKEQLTSARRNAITPSSNKNATNLIKRTPMSLKNTTSNTRIFMSGASSVSHFPLSSSKKRKLVSSGRNSPSAKRSLMHALSSPSCATKPKPITYLASKAKPGNSPFKTPSGSALKAPAKRAKVIGTTIRRYSGHQKRKSLGKKGPVPVPKVAVQSATDDESIGPCSARSDDTYDSFKKCIEPHSRSSTLLSLSNNKDKIKTKPASKKNLASWLEDQEEPTLLNCLPDPRLVRTPSRHNVHNSTTNTLSTSRKKCTKNLPILL